MTDTLLTPEVKAWAGRDYPEFDVTITRRDIQKFAHATGETNPLHFDVDAAQSAGYRDVVAPAMFYVLLRIEPYHLRHRDELEADGSPSEDIPPLASARAMAGLTELTINAAFVAGDTVRCRKQLLDVTEKQGRSGPLVFLHFLHQYDVEDAPVVIERFTRILR